MTTIDVILKDIEDHLFDESLLEQLAERHHYSTFHFGRLFKRQIGQTLGEYVRLRRLSVSATLLRDGVDLLEVTLMCGYQSQEAYTRAFKGLYNFPPRKYVKLMELMTNKEMIQMEEQHVEGWFLSGSMPILHA
ncbi:helix-turn-helix transcriptional regulator [Exiguobacterium indicum]|uniref:helix-turn-helix transcriptional regulator n=1 Tax=Exiguobacterium indicum TaxID=296995 RepID=UPI0009FA563E|nr:helix-turn-helix transcriptional regulator [Exiguobacterium indicum]